MTHFNDITVWVYIYNIAVGIIGCVLFCYWWYKIKIASEIYKYFTLLLLTLSFEKVIALNARISSDVQNIFKASHDTLLWHMRTLPTAIILTLIVAMAIRRLMKIYNSKETVK